MARPSPMCTSSRRTISTTSSEWPVRTDTSARGRGHHLFERVAPFRQRTQSPLGVRHPGLARVSQAHAVGGAQEQRRAHLALEAVKARGQRRLGDEEGFGGTAHAAAASHLQEPFDLDQLYGVALAVTRFVYGHGGDHKFYLWRRRRDAPDQTARTQTGPMV